nr:hypothetical protein [Variovorax boronicumulans]
MKAVLRVVVLCTAVLAAACGDEVQAADAQTKPVATDGQVPSVEMRVPP